MCGSLFLFGFFAHGDPDFAEVVGIAGIGRGIDLKLDAFGVFILGALGEELGDDAVVGFDEGFGHFAAALEDGVGLGGDVDDLEVGIDGAAVVFHADAVGELLAVELRGEADAEQAFHYGVLRQAGDQAGKGSVLPEGLPEGGDIRRGGAGLGFADGFALADHPESPSFFDSVVHSFTSG